MKNFSRQTGEEVMKIRNRAEKAITEKISKHIIDLNGVIPSIVTKHNRITYILVRFNGNKFAFTFQTRHCGSKDVNNIIIEKSLFNFLKKLSNECNIVRHLVMFNDGNTVEFDVLNDDYRNDVQELPRRTVSKSGKDYIEKKICRFFNKKSSDYLSFDAEWVYNGKRTEERKPERIEQKPLF